MARPWARSAAKQRETPWARGRCQPALEAGGGGGGEGAREGERPGRAGLRQPSAGPGAQIWSSSSSPPARETRAGGGGEFGSRPNKRAEGASGGRGCPPQESLLPCASAFDGPVSAAPEALRVSHLVQRVPAPRPGPRWADPQNSGDTGAGRASRDARAVAGVPPQSPHKTWGPEHTGGHRAPSRGACFLPAQSWGP